MKNWMALVSVVALTACTDTGVARQQVKPNALGVVAIETARSNDGEVTSYELRGLDAADREVGAVRLRIGAMPQLQLPGEGELGSALTLRAGADEREIVSRETATFMLPALGDAIQRFVEIPEIAATLQHDANVIVRPPTPARGEVPYFTRTAFQCTADQLQTTPRALGCCESYNDFGGGFVWVDLAFVRGRDSAFVARSKNPYGSGCKASDGLASCSGASCFYGPYGFSRANITPPPAGHYPYSYDYWDSVASMARCWYDMNVNGPWKVNFQTASTATPSGYWADTGLAYGDRTSSWGEHRSYGWNVDNTANARERNDASSPDKRYDTFNHMQLYGTRTWEWDTTNLPIPGGGTSNGRYFNVHLVAGDPWNYDSTYKINLESVLGLNGVPTSGQRWIEGWNGWIDVADNRLTVSNASGAVNNKLDYIDILSLRAGKFGDVDGTRTQNGGCCPNGAGPCDIPGAPACSTCGGANAGSGQWDYQ